MTEEERPSRWTHPRDLTWSLPTLILDTAQWLDQAARRLDRRLLASAELDGFPLPFEVNKELQTVRCTLPQFFEDAILKCATTKDCPAALQPTLIKIRDELDVACEDATTDTAIVRLQVAFAALSAASKALCKLVEGLHADQESRLEPAADPMSRDECEEARLFLAQQMAAGAVTGEQTPPVATDSQEPPPDSLAGPSDGHTYPPIGLTKREIGLALGLQDDAKIAQSLNVLARASGIYIREDSRKCHFVALDTLPRLYYELFRSYLSKKGNCNLPPLAEL